MTSTFVRYFGVLALAAGLAGCGGAKASPQSAPSATVDAMESGAGAYAAPKDMASLCADLDYSAFQGDLKKSIADVNADPAGKTAGGEAETCTQTVEGSVTVSGNILTTFTLCDDVDLAKRLYQIEHTPAQAVPGSAQDVQGAGVEASRYLDGENPDAKILLLSARRSNAVVTVRIVLSPAASISDAEVDGFFTEAAKYADQQLTTLRTTAAR